MAEGDKDLERFKKTGCLGRHCRAVPWPCTTHGRGPQQGPQGEGERQQAEAQAAPWAPHQVHQVRQDMCSFALYERRTVELLKVSKDKVGTTVGIESKVHNSAVAG